jgi:hypothetical protein
MNTLCVTDIAEVANNCVITLARVIVLMGATAFAIILILECYLRIQDITKQYRERTYNQPAPPPPTTPPCRCSCTCNLSQNTNEEKEQ